MLLKWENNYFEISGTENSFKIVQKTGGVVIAPQVLKKFILIRVKRMDQKEYWEFPRGFIENDESFEHGAIRELREEMNIVTSDIHDLGEIKIDSGLILSNVRMVLAKVPEYELSKIELQDSEKILDYRLFSIDELCNLIRNKELVDSFTRSICLELLLDKDI
ncbi:NUDIX domain-containing protein [Lactobacillus murinus]|nr:NUDIX domain-containing protein [Ligilactobacillus murinus]NEF86042.1 NUDIX domain-containing protein [Ligilactobacillus murinus]NEF88350.1 NUDIX domain-containing protein [Ligilactobacillus murinus]NEF90615.1 NUDIX domain-containing protein [Ligilactobacillus murinus]NEF92879.1 NUDIX domain-containing protein [Ligilactobacillus murinus]